MTREDKNHGVVAAEWFADGPEFRESLSAAAPFIL
jgi:hypothetical protein